MERKYIVLGLLAVAAGAACIFANRGPRDSRRYMISRNPDALRDDWKRVGNRIHQAMITVDEQKASSKTEAIGPESSSNARGAIA